MKLFKKTLLITITVLSLLSTLGVITVGIILYSFSDSHVDSALMSSSKNIERTEFYRYDFSDRYSRQGAAILMEDAYLDNGIKYEFVSFNEIPNHLINAFIAIEDKRFYKHNGIDFFRSGHAVVSYLTGGERFGGSTITQQLVKNLTGNASLTVSRKISEAFSAINLEKEYDKSEILEAYLNVINLSDGCRGIGAASKHFFSKKPWELTLAEAATIAAITNNPSRYNPRTNPQNNLARRRSVLRCMLDQGYISLEEYNSAITEELKLNITESSSGINSWYVDMVVEDVIDGLCEKYGITSSAASLMLYRGGYKIYTAIDNDVQSILDKYYSNEYNFPINKEGKTAQSAMIVIDPYTGDVLGVAGAIGTKKGNRLRNFATQAKRPPGSTIKPLAVYTPALEEGIIDWSSIIEDSPCIQETEFGVPWPQNVDRSFVGKVDVKYAIEHSLNTVSVKVLRRIGATQSAEFLADKLMMKNVDKKRDIGESALALGQFSNGVTLRELSAAYSIYQEGIMSKPRSFFKVCDKDGVIILDNAPAHNAVISRETAAIMTKLLEAVVDTGTASGKIKLDKNIEVAGKSGTSSNCCDRYFIGYTPELLAGVWFGYEYPKNLEEFGGNLSVYIWDDIMNEIYEKCEYGRKTMFSIPDTVREITYGRTKYDPESAKERFYTEKGWFKIS